MVVFFGCNSAFFVLQTQRVEFLPKSYIFVSSDHMTFSQSSSGSSKCSLANFRRGWTCTGFSRGTRLALQDLSPWRRSVLLMVGFVTLVPALCSEDDHTTSVRQCLSGHKRRAKCILLAILPRPLQSAQGYPIFTSICWSLSTELRRQDDIDEEKQQTWVEALTQELVEDEDPFVDPDYEAGSLAMGCLTGPNPSLLTLVV
uniref:Uncharacterized protein n=1 Tax=Oncorhynchus tshawytscha TaxID=74940 RepID=A0A8C8CS80_ONCTS